MTSFDPLTLLFLLPIIFFLSTTFFLCTRLRRKTSLDLLDPLLRDAILEDGFDSFDQRLRADSINNEILVDDMDDMDDMDAMDDTEGSSDEGRVVEL
ncbi:hypothetical protein TrLO_g9585 [Triparma laevis f. longispina]|uniref:Uncharacterized protein n=1 Tax=Triparma laevis f. longispina TaxID=1714387 RepID=A0A9W7C5Q7_9STRA|nr:hypothetical protein TrLO_g9585 [Triparma laevis f. longispina]